VSRAFRSRATDRSGTPAITASAIRAMTAASFAMTVMPSASNPYGRRPPPNLPCRPGAAVSHAAWPLEHPVAATIFWSAGLLLVFVTLSLHSYAAGER